MIKAFAVPHEMHEHVGRARVFDFEDTAVDALIKRQITPGDVVVIRYEGPRANGMPEMYYASTIISSDPTLNVTTALVTDGRYSGAMRGPCVGHVAPEALDGGPIGLVEENDLIEINIPERRLAIVGINGEQLSEAEVDVRLEDRRRQWVPPPRRHSTGILSLYERVARTASEGAAIT
jgi:dihydroxy-acid dehydratase